MSRRILATGAHARGSASRAGASARRRALLLITACVSAVGVSPAVAQQASSASAQLGEIIVTARKRQESILNVPVVETALPAEQLQRYQVTDLNGIARLV